MKITSNSILYNYRVVKRYDKDNGTISLAKVGGKRPKYATIEYVDGKFDELKQDINKLNYKLDKLLSK